MNRIGHSLCPAAQRCEEHPSHWFWAVPIYSRSGAPARMQCEGFSFTEEDE